MKYRMSRIIFLLISGLLAAGTSYATFYPPVAQFDPSATAPTAGQTVYFTDTSYDADENGDSIVAWKWTFPSEAFYVSGQGTPNAACKFPATIGTYDVYLSVQDDEGVWATSTACQIDPDNASGDWYVDAAGSDEDNDGQNSVSPFERIQTAIDGASGGDCVWVAEGTYYENINFQGKNITVRSMDPDDSAVVANTIIDAGGVGTAVSFRGSEDSGEPEDPGYPACLLTGFTIRGGGDSDGLLAHWEFEDDYTDSVGDNDGTEIGSPSFEDTEVAVGSYSLDLEGTGDYVTITGYKGIPGRQARTCAAWIRTEATGSASEMDILYWGENNSGERWRISLDPASNKAYLKVDVLGGHKIGTTNVADGQWHHVAVTWENDGSPDITDAKLYVDGVLETGTSDSDYDINTSTSTGADDVSIGKSVEEEYFNGLIDDVQIYGRALDGLEVSELAFNPDPGSHWEFDGNALDSTGENDGSENGSSVYSTTEKKVGTASLIFDETNYITIGDYKGIVGTRSRSVTAWIRKDADSGDTGDIIGWGSTMGTGQGWKVYVDATGHICVDVNGDDITADNTLDDNVWYHLAVLLEDDGSPVVNEIEIYVNGKKEPATCTDGTTPINTNSGNDVTIGYVVDYFDGNIDDVRIYGRAIGGMEILELAGIEPVGHWKLDEESTTTTAADSGSGNHNGMLQNMAGNEWADGMLDNALEFDGTDDYVKVIGYEGITGNASRSVCAWIRTQNGEIGDIVSWGINTGVGTKWRFTIGWSLNPNSIQLHAQGGNITSTTDVCDDRWHHVAVVFENDGTPNVEDVRLFVDGEEEVITNVNPVAINTSNDADVEIGKCSMDSASCFKGFIDDVRIYEMALSAGQIKDMAAERSYLEAYWPFDDGTGQSTAKNKDVLGIDNIGFYDGTLTNMDSNNDWVDGIFDSALYFDGTDEYVQITDYKGITGSASRSVCAWIRTQDGEIGDIVSWGINTGTGTKWRFTIGWSLNPNSIQLHAQGGNITSTTDVCDDRWHHVAVVFENDGTPNVEDVRLFVDGVEEAITNVNPVAINTSNDADVEIGKCSMDSASCFKGFIDDVRIYNIALTPKEIEQLFLAHGGGINGKGTHAEIRNCVIEDNYSDYEGGGIFDVDGIISNCVIVGNTAYNSGGGLADCDGTIQNSIVAENMSLLGGGFDNCQAAIVNCTVVSNLAITGGGLWDCATLTGTSIKNCIIWDNHEDLLDCDNVTYSCIENAFGTDTSGDGNIFWNPGIDWDTTKDAYARYRLNSSDDNPSLCINAGFKDPVNGNADYTDQVDIDNELRVWLPDTQDPDSGTIDIGADESDKEFIVRFPDGSSWQAIQDAIYDALDGDVVVIPPGTYVRQTGDSDLECLHGKIVTSVDPDDPYVVANTILDCNNKGRAFIIHCGETNNAAIRGITIKNGYVTGSSGLTGCGGGILCDGSSPTIDKCVISNCTAGQGGGVYLDDGSESVITDCEIHSNNATDDSEESSAGGGGIACVDSDASISRCYIHSNIASGGEDGCRGGGILIKNCSPTVESCLIVGNQTGMNTDYCKGGGLWIGKDDSNPVTANPVIKNCAIYHNQAPYGGGMRIHEGGNAQVVNCTIADNHATIEGGALSIEDEDGAISVTNSIIWGNTYSSQNDTDVQVEGVSQGITYSCIQDDDSEDSSIPFGGAANGNIDDDPRLVYFYGDPLQDDYAGVLMLCPGSPCIDAGDNNAANLPSTDIEGITRILDGDDVTGAVVDMGAYEYYGGVFVDAGDPQFVSIAAGELSVWVFLDGLIEGGDGLSWTAVWSLEAVQPLTCMDGVLFYGTVDEDTFVEMFEPGYYTLRLAAVANGVELDHDEVVITVNDQTGPPNKQPVVEAKSCEPQEQGSTVHDLVGSVIDDGLPFGDIDIRWSVASYPASGCAVIFEDENSAVTTAEFAGATGYYVLKLSATDGATDEEGNQIWVHSYIEADISDITTITEPPFRVDAGVYDPILPGDETDHRDLSGTVTDNSGDPKTWDSCLWTVKSGPFRGASFSAPAALDPTVTFTKPDRYVLELAVTVGNDRVTDETCIDVVLGLTVDAGADKEVTLPTPLPLDDASVIYQGQTAPNYAWSMVSGPGIAAFYPPYDATDPSRSTDLNPKVNFFGAGTYILRLSAGYGSLRVSDDIEVKCKPGGQVSGGMNHTLFVDETGKIGISGRFWWPGAISSSVIFKDVPAGGQGDDPLQRIIAVHGGNYHGFAIDSDRKLWAWGYDYEGQLGIDDGTNTEVSDPVQVREETSTFENVRQVVDGPQDTGSLEERSHGLAVKEDGTAWSWGANWFGVLGNGLEWDPPAINNSHYAIQVNKGEQDNSSGHLEYIESVASGLSHCLALAKSDAPGCAGNVFSWGNNGVGELGYGDSTNKLEPVIVKSGEQNLSPPNTRLSNIIAIAAGSYHSLALENTGHVYAWGYNGNGSLGTGESFNDLNNSELPMKVQKYADDQSLQDLTDIDAISAGVGHTIALDSSGHVWAWGSNYKGQLGINDEALTESIAAVKVVGPDIDADGTPDGFLGDSSPIIAIGTGNHHCMALDEQGRLWAWGKNEYGQLSLGRYHDKIVDYELGEFVYLPQRVIRELRVHNKTQDIWYGSIQVAIDDNAVITTGDTIVAYPGIYNETVDFKGLDITVTSLDPDAPAIVASTIINGGGSGDVVKFGPDNSPPYYADGTITGFTITNAQKGVNIPGGSPNIIHNRIVNNDTGIFFGGGQSPVIESNHITNNRQCGVHCYSNSQTLKILNNVIDQNGEEGLFTVDHGTVYAGIFFESTSTLTVICNNTIVENGDLVGAVGYGIVGDGGTEPDIDNCIIWGNAGGQLSGITEAAYSCIQDGGVTGDGNITSDPLFVNALVGDYRLQEDSTCVDAGDAAQLPLDLDDLDGDGDTSEKIPFDILRNPRVSGADLDIGAYEYPARSVNAGLDKKIVLSDAGNTVDLLDASVTYNGLDAPTSSTSTTYSWTVVSGPATVDMTQADDTTAADSSDELNPTATFSQSGTYVLQLEVIEDGDTVGWDKVTITVKQGVRARISTSEPQAIQDDHKIILPDDDAIDLDGDIWDDSTDAWEDSIADWTVEWTCDNPEASIATDPVAANPEVTFAEPGLYTMVFTVKDDNGEIVGADSVSVAVEHEEELTVEAEALDTVFIGPYEGDEATVDLYGLVTGGEVDAVEWVYLGGDGDDPTIADSASLATTVMFTSPGTYEFALLAKEGDETSGYTIVGSAIETVTVTCGQTVVKISTTETINEMTGMVEIALPAGQDAVMNLSGAIRGAQPESILWEPKNNASNVNIGGNTSPNTWGTFSAAGVYEIELQALQSTVSIASDRIVVKVGDPAGFASVQVNAGGDGEYVLPVTSNTMTLPGEVRDVDTSAWVNFLDATDNTGWPYGIKDTEWFRTDSIVTVTPSASNALESTVAFQQRPGDYTFGLIAWDSDTPATAKALGIDYVDIMVLPYDITAQAWLNSGHTSKYEDGFTLMPGEKVYLFGSVSGSSAAEVTTKWRIVDLNSSDPLDDVGEIDNEGNDLDTEVEFYDAGMYVLVLEALYDFGSGEVVVASDAVVVNVTYPQVIVDAWIEDDGGDYKGDFYVITDLSATSELTLDGWVTGATEVEWVVLEGPQSVTFSPTGSPGTTATFTEPGIYKLALNGKVGGGALNRKVIDVVVYSNGTSPLIVHAGQKFRPVFMDPEADSVDVSLSDAFVVPTTSSVLWSTNSPDVSFSNTSEIKPIVTIKSPGIYELTLKHGSDPTITDTTTILVYPKGDFLVVEAGTYKDIKISETLSLDKAWDICALAHGPMYSGIGEYTKSYEWSVLAGPTTNVDFYLSPNGLNPAVSFSKTGTYVLELSVTVDNDDIESVTEKDQVVINVQDEDYDSSGPTVTLTAPETVLGSGIYDVVVTAVEVESNIRNIQLILYPDEGVMGDEIELKKLRGGPFYPLELEMHHSFDVRKFPSGPYTLRAVSSNIFGVEAEAPTTVTVTNSNKISRFQLSATSITDDTTDLSISATSTVSTGYWKIEIFDGDDLLESLIQMGDLGAGVDIAYVYSVDDTWGDGNYSVKLTIADDDDYTQNCDTSMLPFDVAIGLSADSIFAEITNADLDDGDGYYENGVTIDARGQRLPIIDDGIYELKGSAYHDSYENVWYKVELFDGDVNPDRSFAGSWKSSYYHLVKNFTQDFGYTENGFINGNVGKGSESDVFGELNFTDVPNGVYQLLLTVKCNGVEKYDTRRFVLDCPLKIGSVQFSQEDVVIPVGGIPLRIVRTYNSLNRHREGDFGYGWEFSIVNMDIELNESRSEMGGWTERNGGDFDRDVTLTLPDGRRATFTSKLESHGGYWSLGYDSPPGVDATLRTSDYFELVNGGGGSVRYFWRVGGTDFVNIHGSSSYIDLSVHDVPGWVLTTADGTEYNIERGTYGVKKFNPNDDNSNEFEAYAPPYLKSIVMPSGEKIEMDLLDSSGDTPLVQGVDAYLPTVNEDGTFTYGLANKSIKFTRDSEGRIEKVYPPSELNTQGNLESDAIAHVEYSYDPDYGNLTEVRRLVDRYAATDLEKYEITKYYYGDGSEEGVTYRFRPDDHYITDIEDERGLTPIRYVYDSDGRLIETIDAKGEKIVLRHGDENDEFGVDAVVGSVDVEVVYGRIDSDESEQKHPTAYYYDERGNVLQVDRYRDTEVYSSTAYKYDSTVPEYIDKPTQVRQSTDLHANGNMIYATTAMSYSTSSLYSETIYIEETVDPVKNKTINTYDANRNLLTSTQYRLSDPDDENSGYEEVSTTRNTYDDDSLLKATEITTGSGGSLVRRQFMANVYDGRNRILHTVRVDTDKVSDFTSLYTLTDTGISALSPADGYVVTTYEYSGSQSSELSRISEPYNPGDNPVYNQHFAYDENGNQTMSWYDWIDPDDSTKMKQVVSITDYDAMGRATETRREVTDYILDGQWTEVPGSKTSVILSSTEYNSIGKVEKVEGERLNETGNEEGTLTVYFYDELGNTVETRTYATFSDYDPANPDTDVLTTSQTLYDKEGRTLVTVGPYATGDEPVGIETVYDELGRVKETRRWKNVTTQLEFFKISDTGEKVFENDSTYTSITSDPVGRSIDLIDYVLDNASGEPATNMAWKSDGVSPDTDTTNLLSSSPGGDYDIGGRLKTSYALHETLPDQETDYTYDIAGRRLTVTDALNNVSTTHYDGNRRDYVVDVRGNTTSFVYDSLGRVTTTVHPVTDFVDSLGADQTKQLYSHSFHDGLSRKTYELKPTDLATLPSESSANFNKLVMRKFEYDVAGRLTRVTLPDPQTYDLSTGPVYDYIYDDYGNQVGSIDPKDRLTVSKYNELHQQTERYMPFGITTGSVSSAQDVYTALAAASPAPDVETRQYNTLSRLEKVTDFKGQIRHITYNARGQVEYERYYDDAASFTANHPSNPDKEIEYAYDNLGRKDTVTVDSTLEQDFEYDNEGRVYIIESPQGFIRYEYNSITGRKTATESYDTTATMTTVKNGSAAVVTRTEYTYDALGRLDETILTWRNGVDLTLTSDEEVTTCSYNENGSRESVTLPNQVYTEYGYNALNRLTDLTHYKDNTSTTSTNTLSSFVYSHLADGMRVEADEAQRDATGLVNHYADYEYDSLNRITSEENDTSDDTLASGYTADYTYDLVGNRETRSIAANSGTSLDTTYTYYEDHPTDKQNPDRLWKETNTGTAYVMHWHDQKVYAHADSTGSLSYELPGGGGRIGQFKAFFVGLPSKWSGYFLMAVLVLIPIAFFGPVVASGYRRLRHSTDAPRPALSLYHRCLCMLLTCTFLVGPQCLQTLSAGQVQYSQVTAATWGSGGTEIVYLYDANGAVTKKTTTKTSNSYTLEVVDHTYNLRGRLETVTTTPYVDDAPDTPNASTTSYKYNPQGIRVEKTVDSVVTNYLIDPYNYTGYAQILEEWGTQSTPDVTYTIGDDIITQASTVAGVKHLLYDGHGSTRQLTDHPASGTASATDNYSYDAYGVLLQEDSTPLQQNPGKTPQQSTNLLYAGEYFDTNVQHYNNRARWYNPYNGRFNRTDPYAGSPQDPQSLHKYTYCHANPVNGIDPSGLFIGGLVGVINAISVYAILRGMEYGPKIAVGLWAAIKISSAMWLAALTTLVFQELGVIPHNEYVAEIAAILGYVLILELMVFSMLPASWKYPATPSQQANDPRPRGMHDPRVRKAVEVANYVHYDKTTDPSKYNHEGCPTQLQRIYNKGTKFQFAKRGQKMIDVIWKGGPHPSSYPNSKWPSGINQADFKPDTPTGNAFKLPPDTLRIPYDPQTGQIKH